MKGLLCFSALSVCQNGIVFGRAQLMCSSGRIAEKDGGGNSLWTFPVYILRPLKKLLLGTLLALYKIITNQ